MKLEKEDLIKNHFWILLGIYAPMVLTALMLVWFSVADTVGQQASNLKKTREELKNNNKPDLKNASWTKVLDGKIEKLEGQKNEMWKRVWDGQAAIMTWPAALEAKFPFLKAAYFLDKLPTELRDKYVHDANTYYAQLDSRSEGIVWLVDPVDSRGKGTVQFRNGWENVLTYVPKGRWPPTGVPDSDDCWLAQEDIWVQRELLLCVRDANDFGATLKKLPNPPKPDRKKDEFDHQIFANGRWKLDLILTGTQLRWQLTNVTGGRLPLGMHFKVQRKGVKIPDMIWIDGEPLAPYESTKWGAQKCVSVGRVELDSVKEVFDWRTATVKRIDRIDLYHHSHRTNSKSFTTAPAKSDPNAPADMTAAAPGAGAAAPGGMPGGGMTDTEGQPLGFAGAMGPFGMGMGMQHMIVNKYRYIDWNDQVRRMAIGMLLIVDQSRIQDVLTALANSRLRFQITQVHWQHYTGSVKPIVDERYKNTLTRDPSESVMAGISRMYNMSTGDTESYAPGFGGMAQQPDVQATDAAGNPIVGADEPTNIVELAVYGIASLYQKYPPKSPEAAAPADAAAGTAATPAAAPTPGK